MTSRFLDRFQPIGQITLQEKQATKVRIDSHEYDFDVVANLMDDDIRETLHAQEWQSEQEFVDAYRKAHAEKFGEEFQIN